MNRIVWTALAAAVLAVAGVVYAIGMNSGQTVALGLAAVTFAVLATREK